MKIKVIITAIIFFLNIAAFSQTNWQTYPYSPQGSVLTFPADDGMHTAANTTTEWWYLNLHLIGSAPAYKKYDVMLCYFGSPATMRIFNVADPVSGTFHTDVNQTPFVLTKQVGHWELTYDIPLLISDYSHWTYPTDSIPYSYIFHAESPTNFDMLDVTVTSNRPPLVVGGDGYIPIGEQGDFSYYYSYPNMKVKGSIMFSGVSDSISSGIAWIDRQYGPFIVGINTNNKYEWFSLQVDNPGATLGTPQLPSDYNVWQVYSDSNSIPCKPNSRLVSAIYADNSQDTVSTFVFERTGYWYDQANSNYYSQGWRYINPLRGINIDIEPSIIDQVINVTLFKFWEGGTVMKGTVGDQNVEGVGFAELVAGRAFQIILPSVPSGLSVTPETDHYSLNWTASTPGTYPIGGYRVFRSTSTEGYWKYLATTTDLSYNDYTASPGSGYYYTVTSFDNQTSTSASGYANPVWAETMGINNDSPSALSVHIYPNPVKDKLYIDLPYFKNTFVEIMSIEGQHLQSLILQSQKTAIDVNNLPCGVYFLEIKNDKGFAIKKFIKQ